MAAIFSIILISTKCEEPLNVFPLVAKNFPTILFLIARDFVETDKGGGGGGGVNSMVLSFLRLKNYACR